MGGLQHSHARCTPRLQRYIRTLLFISFAILRMSSEFIFIRRAYSLLLEMQELLAAEGAASHAMTDAAAKFHASMSCASR